MYKLKQLEFKEKNAHAICWVNIISTLVTVGLVIGTLVIVNTEYNIDPAYPNQHNCEGSHLYITMWLMIGMHCINITESVCGLTGLDTIFCGCICIIGFFVYEIAVLIYMQ